VLQRTAAVVALLPRRHLPAVLVLTKYDAYCQAAGELQEGMHPT